VPSHVSQAEIATAVAIGQPCMIETEQMQHRGVQIVRMHWLFHCRQTEFIRGSVCDSTLNPPPASNVVKPRTLWSRPWLTRS